jgi:hypothetical protein
MKSEDLEDKPHTFLEMKEAIADLLKNILPIELQTILAKDACLKARGGYNRCL